eukprot:CAMPEP_0197248008 /NCGR_PEP_ID=MMETSP1429-20130617/32619_1 /TAXON_ID=49237 /ORGANISM="Chaetoceros  sp., Strain UNC1202" /LENGTH=77 /DNA_ID=CAMNT_0042709073 /DNA_START=12 /DNA_END=242 /DNA_ORIENTATION=+
MENMYGDDGLQQYKQMNDHNAQLITVSIKGNAFLYRQVRNMVGCLASVGQGKTPASQVQAILNERDRSKAPSMAPAH